MHKSKETYNIIARYVYGNETTGYRLRAAHSYGETINVTREQLMLLIGQGLVANA